jgi:hypothetical protein
MSSYLTEDTPRFNYRDQFVSVLPDVLAADSENNTNYRNAIYV